MFVFFSLDTARGATFDSLSDTIVYADQDAFGQLGSREDILP